MNGPGASSNGSLISRGSGSTLKASRSCARNRRRTPRLRLSSQHGVRGTDGTSLALAQQVPEFFHLAIEGSGSRRDQLDMAGAGNEDKGGRIAGCPGKTVITVAQDGRRYPVVLATDADLRCADRQKLRGRCVGED